MSENNRREVMKTGAAAALGALAGCDQPLHGLPALN